MAGYCSDCDYCGSITIVHNDDWGGKGCSTCLKEMDLPIDDGCTISDEAVEDEADDVRPCVCGSGNQWAECPGSPDGAGTMWCG